MNIKRASLEENTQKLQTYKYFLYIFYFPGDP